tara:strand:+ start:4406 stop:5827 length:1422 start_codon:yes stop_codon:yes gene_type:complete
MKEYKFIPSKIFIIIATIILISANSTKAGKEVSRKPNLIFILADDLGYGDLGCFGQKKIKTPNLDGMAKKGMKLTQFYAGSTVCAPSRCVLMTGLHTGHAYIRGNGRHNLRPSDFTVAELFKKAGYKTGCFGKWGLGNEGTDGIPTKQGFDSFYGYLHQGHAHNYYPTFLIKNESRIKLRNIPEQESKTGAGWASVRRDYSHDLITENALHWIDMNHNEQFFLYLPFTIPHANNEGKRGTKDGQEVPDYGIYRDKNWTNQNKGQAAMITRMDSDIGRILSKLNKYKISNNTLIIFSSDNGHHREGGNDPEFFNANGPLRGMKRDLYEGGIRVPTIAYWPNRIKAGSTSDQPFYFGDLMATAAELAGTSSPSALDSISFLPTLINNSKQQKKREFIYWEFLEKKGAQALVLGESGRWKALRKNSAIAPIEIYDLKNDIGEINNIANIYPEIVSKAEELFKTEHVSNPLWKKPFE